MKLFSTLALIACTLPGASAAVPQGYYDGLQGKSGADLKQAAKAAAAAHTAVPYGDDTWEAFRTTDVRTVDGREAWFDMYSNAIVWVSTGHSGLNIEHSVANSWWGGVKNDAYKDLFHLNPSNADANNRKSNHPLALIEGTPSWTNGVSSIGAPVEGQGGGAATVFEPADEYKGDFARAFFYVFTVYDDISWIDEPDKDYMYDCSAWPSLRPWAYDMLLQWAEADPVDSREAARNEAVFGIQGNRNPFIDMPALASYIWGAERQDPFDPAQALNPAPVDRPAAPVFGGCTTVAVNTYTARWWSAFEISVGGTSGDIYVSVDGGDFAPCDGTVWVPAATANGEQLLITAYASAQVDGTWYDSSLSTLTLTAKDPALTDLTAARWVPVSEQSQIEARQSYIVVSPSVLAVMAADNGSGKFMPVAGNAVLADDGSVCSVPETTGVVTLLPADGGFTLSVADVYGNPTGCIAPTAPKALRLDEEGVPADITVGAEGAVSVDFGAELGLLQYNKTSPRFLNYTSSQERVALYRLDESSAAPVTVPDAEIRVNGGVLYAPAGSRVFDLGGRPADPSCPEPGVYIVVTPAGHHAKVTL